jgi:NAD(P)-dependent dehydrogenase (short-subunit alcohol dehydrogenase family)
LAKLKSEDWTTVAIARDISEIISLADYTFDAQFDDPNSIEQTLYLVSQKVRRIDFWCYAVGDIHSGKVLEMTPQDWHRILSANLSGAYYAIHYCLPLLNEEAHIFFIGAVSERLRLPGLSAYAASKAGLEAFVEALSKEERRKHITIVRPGAVATPLWNKVPLKLPKDAAPPEKVAEKILEAYHSDHRGKLDLV